MVSISMVPTAAMASVVSAPSGAMASTPTMVVSGPVTTAPLLFKKKKKKKKKTSGLTPESADTKRQAIRDAVKSDVDSENWGAAADETETNAALLGDPVSYQEAAEYRLNEAEQARDIDTAKAAIETATIALDIFHFYDSVDGGGAVSEWLVISPAAASSSISEVESLIERAEELIEEIEAEQESGGTGAAPVDDGKKKRKKRGKAKPGTVVIGVGAGVAALGLGGAGAGLAGLIISQQKQSEVEGLTLPDDQMRVDELDEEGAAANRLGVIGAIVGGVGLAAGVTLIVVGAVQRKKAGGGSGSARIQVAPSVASGFGGLTLNGRF